MLTTKRYDELKKGDIVGSGRVVHNVVSMDMGFVRVYWRDDHRPSQQPGETLIRVYT